MNTCKCTKWGMQCGACRKIHDMDCITFSTYIENGTKYRGYRCKMCLGKPREFPRN